MPADASKPVLVVLGAGKPFMGQHAVGLTESRRFAPLDWCLHAFAALEPEVHFVGGYHFEEVVRQYPHLRYSVNLDWATTGSAASLLLTPLELGRTYFVAYGDVIVSTAAINALAGTNATATVLVDSNPSSQGLRRSTELVTLNGGAGTVKQIGPSVGRAEADALYIGLAKLSPDAVATIRRFREEAGGDAQRWSVAQLLSEVVLPTHPVSALDVTRQWASFDSPQEIARFLIGSKADTLERLAPLVQRSRILESAVTTVGEWRLDRDRYLDGVQAAFRGQKVIVRSSALSEDGWAGSQAGRFRSIKSVSADDRRSLAAAVDQVVDSYQTTDDRDQVLAQPMVYPRSSGVVMTRTLAQGGPYYVVSYADGGSATAAVTSGGDDAIDTVLVHRDFDQAVASAGIPPWIMARLLPAVRELEVLVGHDALDVEFAIDADDGVVLLQLRPIAADFSQWSASDKKVAELVSTAAAFLRDQHAPPPFLVGRAPAWGTMPDWNPAEIIGERPRPLAFSLYQHLITDDTWAVQRAETGYRDVRPAPLVVSLAGHPYVDVRASFNSFVPATLGDALASALVEIYIERLRREPALHDKVEFDVALTCLTFDIDDRIEALCVDGFPSASAGALRDALRNVTKRALSGVQESLQMIEQLETRRQQILTSGMPPLQRASALLADAIRLGTLPFAHLARRAFVATALLRSAVRAGLIDAPLLAAFNKSLRTVASNLARDAAQTRSGTLARAELLSRYGHLRPGTYEITSPTYAETFAHDGLASEHAAMKTGSFEWPAVVSARLDRALAALDLDLDAAGLARFGRQAIEGRESAKFCFTRNLSEALDAIVEFGSTAGLTRDDLSFLTWTDLQPLATGHTVDADMMKRLADHNREHHAVVRAVELPPLIFAPEQAWCFRLGKSRPNFVGTGRVVAPLMLLDNSNTRRTQLRGTIAMTMQADPGWDWLLTEGISGLITAFGGANSHMAVRAAELGLPAAIGVGTLQFDQLRQARVLLLDCDSRRIEIVA